MATGDSVRRLFPNRASASVCRRRRHLLARKIWNCLQGGNDVPFFFDLSSLTPVLERNPFAPTPLRDPILALSTEANEPIAAEPIADTGLPIPAHYDLDLMRALVQDPFRLYVYWNLRSDPFARLRRIFTPEQAAEFRLVLRLIDETTRVTVLFAVPYTREYWFDVFPGRRYRIELGLQSRRAGYIKLLGSQAVETPRGGPSEVSAEDPAYAIEADDYLEVLRESHLVPERIFTAEGLLARIRGEGDWEQKELWHSLPTSFRRIMEIIADLEAGRAYDRWWDRLGEEELAEMVREFLGIIRAMGEGELGYLLLLRYLPELLRRVLRATGEISVDKPMPLFLAEQLGQVASEWNVEDPDPAGRGLTHRLPVSPSAA